MASRAALPVWWQLTARMLTLSAPLGNLILLLPLVLAGDCIGAPDKIRLQFLGGSDLRWLGQGEC